MSTLTHFRFCPASRSVRLALGEHDIDVELAEMRPWEWPPALFDLNPSGELPVLRLDDVGTLLCGSYAISEYLATTQADSRPDRQADPLPPGPLGTPRRMRLFPGPPESQAEVRRLVDWFHGKLQREVTAPLLESHVVPMFKGTAQPPPVADVLRAIRANLAYHLTYVAWLADQRNWLAGDDLSFADLAAGAHISCLDYLGEIDWLRFPAAKAWYQRLKSRKSFQPLLADRVPGRPPAPHYAELDF